MVKREFLKKSLVISASLLVATTTIACSSKNKDYTSESSTSLESQMASTKESESASSKDTDETESTEESQSQLDSSEYESVSEELESIDAQLDELEEQIKQAESDGNSEKVEELKNQKVELEQAKQDKESQSQLVSNNNVTNNVSNNNENNNKNNIESSQSNNSITETTTKPNSNKNEQLNNNTIETTTKPSNNNTSNSGSVTQTKPVQTQPQTTAPVQTQPQTQPSTQPQTTAPVQTQPKPVETQPQTTAPVQTQPQTQPTPAPTQPTTPAPTEPVKQGATPLTASQIELARQTAIKILNQARATEGVKANPNPVVGSHVGLSADARAAEFVDRNMTHLGGSGVTWSDAGYMEGLAAVHMSGAGSFPLTDAQVIQEITELANNLINEPSHKANIVDPNSEEMCIGVASFVNYANGLTIQLVVENYVPFE